MKTIPALIALACGLAAVPALSQSLGLGKSGQQGPARASRQQASRPSAQHPDVNQGRFVAFGGEFGTLRTACSQCHQIDGMGDSSGAFPRLTGQSAWYLYSTLRDFADGKRQSEVMEPIARELSDSQMQDVAAYYATVANVPYPPPVTSEKELIQHGSSIAQTGIAKEGVPACDTCHGQHGVGNPPIYPYLAGQYHQYLQEQLEAFKSGKRKSDPMNVMESIAKRLSDQQIKQVSAYYASLTPQHVAPGGMQASVPGGRSVESQSVNGTAQTVQQNGASNAEQVQHLGATQNPHPQKGDAVVPGASLGQSQRQHQR